MTISSSILRQSTLPGDFPKEATFQHVFMEGLARSTTPDCAICPELSRIFPTDPATSSTSTIPGEIDFYLNGCLRWGIELLVSGSGITEHIARFDKGGKYSPLQVKDYTVVDLRGNDSGEVTNVIKHSNRITVFFKKGDFSFCKCIIGEDGNAVHLDLQD